MSVYENAERSGFVERTAQTETTHRQNSWESRSLKLPSPVRSTGSGSTEFQVRGAATSDGSLELESRCRNSTESPVPHRSTAEGSGSHTYLPCVWQESRGITGAVRGPRGAYDGAVNTCQLRWGLDVKAAAADVAVLGMRGALRGGMASRLALGLGVFAMVLAAGRARTTHDAPGYSGGWRVDELRAVAPASSVRFSLALRPQREDAQAEIERIAMRVSDPRSARYGKYLSGSAIAELSAPAPQSIAVVEAWLSAVPGVTFRRTNEIVSVDGAVDALEQLLRTRFHRVVNTAHGQSRVRAGAFLLPDAVEQAVAAIFGLHGLPLPPRPAARRRSRIPHPQQEPANITPSVLIRTYGVSSVIPAANSTNRQAVAEFQGQCMNQSDLRTFWQTFVMNQVAGATEEDATVVKYRGENYNDQCEGETQPSLDIQYMMGISPGIETWFYDQASMDFCADLKAWTQLLLQDDDAPLVNSVSYGWQGNLTQVQCSADLVTSIDNDFAKLAAKGITIVFASGDSGSGYAPDCGGVTGTALTGGELLRSIPVQEAAVCCEIAGKVGGKAAGSNPDWQFQPKGGPDDASSRRQLRRGPPSKLGNCSIFRKGTVTGTIPAYNTWCGGPMATPNPTITLYPSWPASSPWVTSVGGTRFRGEKEGNPEMATDQFGSGGGFSSLIKQSPDAKWQSSTVAKYFQAVNKSTLPPASAYDPQGRATPDVSALAEGVSSTPRR